MHKKRIAVFFSEGVSLEIWQKKGMFSREVKYYQELQKKVGRVCFFTYGKNDLQYIKRVGHIKILPKKLYIYNKLYELLIPFLYVKELKKANYLRTHQMRGALAAVVSKFLYKKKLVVRCGYQWSIFLRKRRVSRIKQFLAYLIELVTFKFADKIIVTSKLDKAYVKKHYSIIEKKIRLIPNYVDTNLFKPIKCKKTKNSLCFVGRLTQQKNLFNLLRAIKNLNVSLTIIGSGNQDSKIKEFVEKNKLRVRFKGNIANEKLPEELNKHEVFILPSFYEGNPKALLEAMSCGLPVIATRVEGIKEIITHKQNGYLCETSAESLKKGISDILKDKILQKKISRNARITVVKNFDLKKVLKKEVELYE